ncbi:diacylglycerol/lipid kinase family protein [candidate division CSSED10-310 bacterium]|uniref:Diacylglycerol/lipid kinase family protein n=1 Tax=candidate division CSSED10-310 bacterium TaxID=2855610 RepID=A0ABV6YR98_UNCC1
MEEKSMRIDTALEPDLSPRASGHGIAVLLNENAKKVTGRVKRAIADVVPRSSFYTSHTSEEAYQHVKDIIDRGYERIFSGGGDGSIIQLMNMVRSYVDEKNTRLEALSRDMQQKIQKINYPRLGILKLGTGNGMSYLVGAKRGLRNIRKALVSPDTKTLNLSLIEAENWCFTFSGLGWDAAIQNDFVWFREKFRRFALARQIGGLGGYLTAMAVRTIPREIFRRKPAQVTIRNSDGPVYRAEYPDTMRLTDIGPGDVIYQGPVNVTGVGTVPYYGFKFTAFPFSRIRSDMMNLRIVRAGVFECISHAYSIWTGKYTGQHFLDFLTSGVTMEFSEQMPLQMGGDPYGYRSNIEYTMSNHQVEVIDLNSHA